MSSKIHQFPTNMHHKYLIIFELWHFYKDRVYSNMVNTRLDNHKFQVMVVSKSKVCVIGTNQSQFGFKCLLTHYTSFGA